MQDIYNHNIAKGRRISKKRARNGGWVTFLSYEDPKQDTLVGLLRLRKLTKNAGKNNVELKGGQVLMVALIARLRKNREASDAERPRFQHRGYGEALMKEAERIARDEHGSTKMAVISGVGTRNYYRKLGYKLEGSYMVKSITDDFFLGRRKILYE